MAVNLTKPFQGREYTPTHLMDEEESIQRSVLTTASEKLPSYTPEHIAYEPAAPERGTDIKVSVIHAENAPVEVKKVDLNTCMAELLDGIENADDDTKERFMGAFLKAAKKKKKSMKKYEFAPLISMDAFIYISKIILCCSFICLLLFFYPKLVEFVGNLSSEIFKTLLT